MNRVPESVTSLEDWLADLSAPAATEPAWLAEQKREARQRLRDTPMPGRKQEIWRYSNPASLLEQNFRRAGDGLARADAADLAPYRIPDLDSRRLVLVNGRFAPELSQTDDLPEGVRIGSLQQMLQDQPEWLQERLNRVAGAGAHVFAALNTADMDDGFVLHLAPECRLEQPLELIHLSLGGDQPRLIQPRHLVLLEDGAEATLLERYVGHAGSVYCTNNLVEIELGKGAGLAHHRLQEESASAFHLSGVYLSLDADSRYRGSNVALGAAWSRTDVKVNFQAPGAESEMDGLYLAGDSQLVDFHLDVEHGVPGCASREHFKGLLNGKGRAVLDGRIHVAKQAQKTDAHLKNANLLLSRQAEVDTKPQLEILADDVKCSHGATVGQIDANALFYLRSRGIPEAEAKRMLCIGFAGEIIERCGPEALRRHIEDRVAGRLG